MEEITYFNKHDVQITNLQVSTKSGNVLLRDISAVELKSPASARFFGVLGALFFGLVAAALGQSGHTGLLLVSMILAIICLVAAFNGRKVVVTTSGGKDFEIASGLGGEMRSIKDAISRAMTA